MWKRERKKNVCIVQFLFEKLHALFVTVKWYIYCFSFRVNVWSFFFPSLNFIRLKSYSFKRIICLRHYLLKTPFISIRTECLEVMTTAVKKKKSEDIQLRPIFFNFYTTWIELSLYCRIDRLFLMSWCMRRCLTNLTRDLPKVLRKAAIKNMSLQVQDKLFKKILFSFQQQITFWTQKIKHGIKFRSKCLSTPHSKWNAGVQGTGWSVSVSKTFHSTIIESTCVFTFSGSCWLFIGMRVDWLFRENLRCVAILFR